jgi:hypothetical protein
MSLNNLNFETNAESEKNLKFHFNKGSFYNNVIGKLGQDQIY